MSNLLLQVDYLPLMTRALYDANEDIQEEAIREFRKLLSIGQLISLSAGDVSRS